MSEKPQHEFLDEIKLSPTTFAKFLRDGLIAKNLIPPIGHPLREQYEWKFSIDCVDEGWELTVFRNLIPEKEPEKEPYKEGDWKEEGVY